MPVKIALDCMGGDHGIAVTVPAAVDFLRTHPDSEIILVGDEIAVNKNLSSFLSDQTDRISVVHASEVVGMDEGPAQALRGKKSSSMRIAINQVHEGHAAACISAGNTGALMAIARFVLKTLPEIERPAIASFLPTVSGRVCMLDLGANIDCSPEQLYQFAVMGKCLVTASGGSKNPSVGLLNVGEEEIKGNETVKAAAELLKQSNINYHGYVEGTDIYKGTTDVIVCDGFVGNVALKTSEGLAQMLGHYLKEEFHKNIFSKLIGIASSPVINRFRRRVDHRRYNGASLLGLKGVVVKSHGSADQYAMQFALERAYDEVKNNILQNISLNVELTQKGMA